MGVQAFEDFYARDYARLVAAIGLAVGSTERAQEAVDEALARAWEQRGAQDIDSLAGWVRVVALNVARSDFRRRSAERRAGERLAARATINLPGTDNAAAMDVATAIAKLTRRQREVLILHYFLDVPVRDIARELRLSEGTVKSSLHRARAAMAAELNPAGIAQ